MPRPRSDVSSRSPFSHSLSCIQTKFMRSAIRDQEGTPIGPMTPVSPRVGVSAHTRSSTGRRHGLDKISDGVSPAGRGGVPVARSVTRTAVSRGLPGCRAVAQPWSPCQRGRWIREVVTGYDRGLGSRVSRRDRGSIGVVEQRGDGAGSVAPVVWVGNECCGHLECFPFECPLPLAADQSDQSDRLLALLFREISPTCRET